MARKACYIYNDAYVLKSDDFIPTTNRNHMVHTLVQSCQLFKHITPVRPRLASYEDLSAFHSKQYLDYIINNEVLCYLVVYHVIIALQVAEC